LILHFAILGSQEMEVEVHQSFWEICEENVTEGNYPPNFFEKEIKWKHISNCWQILL